jgi:anaerobic magnesium-protoporphyrin IX monomethyl ester cyclase
MNKIKILLVVYDNDSYISWFPQGLAYVAAVLEKAGHKVEIYNQDLHHYPDEHLTEYLDTHHFDVVGVSIIAGYYQYRKVKKLAVAINKSKDRPHFLLGGHGPAPDPEHFFKITDADVIVIGEGENTIVDLVASLCNNGKLLKDIDGIAYRELSGEVKINKRRVLIKDIDEIPFPAYHLFPIHIYRLLRMPHAASRDFVMPVLSGRGCTFRCNFCFRLDKGFRGRSNKAIIEEIKLLKRDFGITYIAFSDELLMVSKERTVSLCEALIKAELNIKWDCNGRLNFAVPEVLRIMKKAGCVFINYGIEAMDDEVLKRMKKGLRVKQVVSGIEATLKEDISPGFNIIFGHIGDTKETLQKGVDFLLKYDDGAQLRTIRPVTPYPGSPLYDEAVENGLIKDCEDFYINKHKNSDLLAINFTELSDDEFHQALHDANLQLINNYIEQSKDSYREQLADLYLNQNVNFRGFRHT